MLEQKINNSKQKLAFGIASLLFSTLTCSPAYIRTGEKYVSPSGSEAYYSLAIKSKKIEADKCCSECFRREADYCKEIYEVVKERGIESLCICYEGNLEFNETRGDCGTKADRQKDFPRSRNERDCTCP